MDLELDSFEAWRARPSKATTSQVLSTLAPTVESALHSYGGGKDPVLRATAYTHVVDALPRFDPSKGVRLSTYMFNELKRLQRIIPKQQYAIPVPEQAMLESKTLDRQEKELTEELGREPTSRELSDATHLSSKRIAALRASYTRPSVTGQALDTARPQDNQLDADEMWLDAVYDELDPIDQKIMDWTLGRNGQPILTKRDMATRLNMSAPAVTKRAQRLSARIQDGYGFNI